MFNIEFILMYLKFARLWAEHHNVNIEISDLLEKSYEILKNPTLEDIEKDKFIRNEMIPVLTRSFVPPAIRIWPDNDIYSSMQEI